VKEFAELGTTEAMDKSVDVGSGGDVLDGFAATPIMQGKGRADAKMFLDGNHSRVRSKYINVYLCTL
jgi:hypothetical protein